MCQEYEGKYTGTEARLKYFMFWNSNAVLKYMACFNFMKRQ